MHDADEPCIAEEMLDRLMPALLRGGAVEAETLLDLAEQLDREAVGASSDREAGLFRMALALRTWVIEAEGPTQAEWEAGRRRKGIRIVAPLPGAKA